MISRKIDNTTTYYPFLTEADQITAYEPCITITEKNDKTFVDFYLNVANIDLEKWNNIKEILDRYIFPQQVKLDNTLSSYINGGFITSGGIVTFKP